MTETSQILYENDGPELVWTNYWQSPMARQGFVFLTTNAGVFRLLMPRQHYSSLRDMRLAELVVVSRGPLFDTLGGHPGKLLAPDAVEVLFDDGTDDPWSLHITPRSMDRVPPNSNQGRQWRLSVWHHLVGERGRKVLERPCAYRVSPRLPDLRSWEAFHPGEDRKETP